METPDKRMYITRQTYVYHPTNVYISPDKRIYISIYLLLKSIACKCLKI